MNTPLKPTRSGPDEALIAPGQTMESVTRTISDIPLRHPYPRFWWTGFLVAFALVMLLVTALAWLFARGIGIWGINVPIAWGFAIVNFVWWIGIGHAGTRTRVGDFSCSMVAASVTTPTRPATLRRSWEYSGGGSG